MCPTAGVIALGAIPGVIASAGRRRRERELADLKAIADAAQQILLRPVPPVIPPAGIAVRYVSAAASARIGGDLYEAVPAGGGVRLIVGDVLGKGRGTRPGTGAGSTQPLLRSARRTPHPDHGSATRCAAPLKQMRTRTQG
jgi:hypothetical protein